VALVVALLAAVTVACTPPTPGDGGTNAQQQFCEFYDKVETQIAEAPPEVPDAAALDDNAVLVKTDVVAAAEETAVTGSSCTDAAAKVELDGAVIAEGAEVPAEQGNTSSGEIAAVTGDEIAPEQPVLENVQLKALSASIGANGITVRGNVAIRLSGQTSTIGFTGTLTNLDNWSIGLSSSAFSIPGVTSSPATFAGTLAVKNGTPTLTLNAQATSAKIGDVTVTNAAINLVASPTTGVSAKVQGNVKVGPSSASGVVDVSFDKTGKLISAKADISARLVGTQAGGKKIDLTGTVKFEGNATETVASFTGSGVVGDLVVNEANGSLTLATNKATFVGVLDVQQGANWVRFNGSIVWDGITAYTPFLQLEGGGEYSGTLNDGQTVEVAGTVETVIVGGQLRAVVTGTFKVGTLKATGSAIVETNGATTTLFVDAALTDAGFAAQIEGAIIITDGIAETVQLDAAVTGSVNFGDATLTGATLSIRSSYGSPLDLKFTGGLKIGSNANVNGTVAASFGPNGTLISLDGSVVGSLNVGGWALVNFAGRVVASPEQVTLSGSGGLSTVNFPLGVNFNGTFTSSLTQPSWTLTGSGNLRIASLTIASARLNLSQTAGMKATRAGFYFTVLIFPAYFEADFYMKPGGGCEKVDLTGGSFLMRPLLAIALPGVIGCPVNL
jgi:hypothetical protein